MHAELGTPSSEIMQIAARARLALGPLVGRVESFVHSRMQPDGGVMGRAGGSDLYYAPFAVEILLALGSVVPAPLQVYVASFGVGEGLDFMHSSCLCRCWARLPALAPEPGLRGALREAILACRATDGGFNTLPGCATGSVTGCFMALNALCDLGVPELVDRDGILHCLDGLRTPDGGYSNDRGMRSGTALAAAGVQTLYHWLRHPTEAVVADWLLRQMHDQGGFPASPDISLPDLLSTATVLYALCVMGVDLQGIHHSCEVFIDGLMDGRGGYCGHWLDDTEDLEYTYYGLMSLGCLQLPAGGAPQHGD